MSKHNYLEKLILENQINKIDELLSRKESFNKLIAPQSNGKTALLFALENNKFEIVNLFGRHRALESNNFNIVQFVLINEKMNESTKLKYLQLFYTYDININIMFMIDNSINKNISMYSSTLEYTIDKQYLHIFNWLSKSNIPHSFKSNFSILNLAFIQPKNKIAKAIIDMKTPIKSDININSKTPNEQQPLLNGFLWSYITNIQSGSERYENDILLNKCEFLISRGYDINLVDKMGYSILHVSILNIFLIESNNKSQASSKVLIDFIKYLIENTDIDINLKDNEGLTAYDLINKSDSIDKFKKKMILSLFSF